MIDNMYAVMQRISEIQKRFGLQRPPAQVEQHRQTEQAQTDFSALFRNSIEAREGEELTEREKIDRIADYYAAKNRVPAALVKAVIDAESGYDSTAVSSKGAMGLMQLMPATARALGVSDPFSPEDNIRGGVAYLREMLNRYNGSYEKALAAYNAGPGAVDRAGGIPNYSETRHYVNRVLNNYKTHRG